VSKPAIVLILFLSLLLSVHTVSAASLNVDAGTLQAFVFDDPFVDQAGLLAEGDADLLVEGMTINSVKAILAEHGFETETRDGEPTCDEDDSEDITSCEQEVQVEDQ
jgi:hypothetical protein